MNAEKKSVLSGPRISEPLLLWAVGIAQPASPQELVHIIEMATKASLPSGMVEAISHQCTHYVERGILREVNKKRKWFSLTQEGELRIPKDLRRRRDRVRIFLLKACRFNRIERAKGDGTSQNLVDVSSTRITHESPLQEIPRPTESCVRGSGHERFRWPRIFEQIAHESGSALSPFATSSLAANPLTFYSFSARHREVAENPYLLNVKELALAIGVSARLLTAMAHKTEHYYRFFELQKATGGTRPIAAPRTFLKVVQYWLNDYVLFRLPVHDCCFSFLPNVSIKDNATCHIGQHWVATIDVENYFGSITTEMVASIIKRAGHTKALARIVSKLTTLNGTLPQGAPTSPILSNSFLFGFDQRMNAYAKGRNCIYSRYADDITVSGDHRDAVEQCLSQAKIWLNRLGLKVKDAKTRIQSRHGRQTVTGLVVNKLAQPSREQRRAVRAKMHHYLCGKMTDEHEIRSLKGWLSYMRSFDHLRDRFPVIEQPLY